MPFCCWKGHCGPTCVGAEQYQHACRDLHARYVQRPLFHRRHGSVGGKVGVHLLAKVGGLLVARWSVLMESGYWLPEVPHGKVRKLLEARCPAPAWTMVIGGLRQLPGERYGHILTRPGHQCPEPIQL